MPHLIPTFALGYFLCPLSPSPHLLRFCLASACPIQANGGRYSYQPILQVEKLRPIEVCTRAAGWSLLQLGFGSRSDHLSSGFPQKHRPTDAHFYLAYHGAMTGRPPSSTHSVGPAAVQAQGSECPAERPQNRPFRSNGGSSQEAKGLNGRLIRRT